MSCCKDIVYAPAKGNFSSGHTAALEARVIECGIPVQAQAITGNVCCNLPTPPGLPVQRPSQLLASRSCPPPTPEEFALYPKVAVPESVRTQAKFDNSICVARLPAPEQRFAQYNRYNPPVPCQALPQEANMAGISKPSTRNCPPTPR